MKKLITLMVGLGVVLTLSACTTTGSSSLSVLTSKESIATLSYLSGSLIDLDTTEPIVVIPTRLSDTEETEIETELDVINVYVDRLKELMENGTDSFGNAVEAVSDNPLYASMITFTVNEEVYVLYYNIDEVTFEITGILVMGDVEYTIEVSNSLLDKDDLDDDDDLEEGDQDKNLDNEESERKMVLTAYNGDNYVVITYKSETEEDETTTKFHLVSYIDGIEKEVFLKISMEDNHYKIDIEENGNEFTFKKNVEDGVTVYKLKYEVNGVEGEIKIIEKTNDLGETVYEYQIKEGDISSTTEKDGPNYHSDDDDEDHEDEDDSEIS